MKQLIFIFIVVISVSCKQEQKENELVKLSGSVFGTSYNIQYHHKENTNFINQIDSLFNAVNQSLSTYIPNSDISKLNRNEINKVDHYFVEVFKSSKTIYKETEGVFDPTIGNVVNAWNFGAENNKFLTDSTTIDSLMQFVGFDKLSLSNETITKPKSTYIEFNAIAKGYGVDVIGKFLESKNIDNYLVEIGGEIRAKGKNIEKQSFWKVGIQRPRFDGVSNLNDYVLAIPLKNEAMATSGSYRKFKTDENGNRYAHIINTKTGYPSKTNVLSVSVIAKNCMTADAYATAFQAMGIEKVTEFLKSHPQLKAFIIYENKNKELKTLNFNNFPE
jgi:thiamine biosynthesis lipoprotein